MSTTIHRRFTFEAAHWLPHVPARHKCARLHGHSYRVTVYVTGEVDSKGWICDFADLTLAFEPLRQALDHNVLNEISGLANPTSEVLARWIFERLKPSLPGLCRVSVQETEHSGCDYTS